jgi:nitrate reductase NapE component
MIKDADPRGHETEEHRSFTFLTLASVTAVTVMFIALYGFIVWIYRILFRDLANS